MTNLTLFQEQILKRLREARQEGATSVGIEKLVTYSYAVSSSDSQPSDTKSDTAAKPVRIAQNLRILKRKKLVDFESGDRIVITTIGLTAISRADISRD